MKNPSTTFLAKLIVVLLWPGLVIAQSEYEQQILNNQQELLRIQQQQLNIIQQEQFERDSERRQAKNRETEELWLQYTKTNAEARLKQEESDSFFRAHCNGIAAMKPKDRANYSKEARKIDPEGKMKCPSER